MDNNTDNVLNEAELIELRRLIDRRVVALTAINLKLFTQQKELKKTEEGETAELIMVS